VGSKLPTYGIVSKLGSEINDPLCGDLISIIRVVWCFSNAFPFFNFLFSAKVRESILKTEKQFVN